MESEEWLPDIASVEWLPVIDPPDIEPDEWLPDIEPDEWLPDIASVEWLPDIEPDEWLPDIESVFEDCASATPEKQALRMTKDVIVLMERNMKVLLRSHVARLRGVFPSWEFELPWISPRSGRHRL